MSNYTPHVKCNAKSKRTGEECKRPAINGTGKCYHHGGKSLAGIASGTYKTGAYSKHLPTRLAATYAETLADQKLWELGEKAALVNTRIVELLSKLDTGETGATWKALREAYNAMRDAMTAGDSAKMMSMVFVIGNLIEAGNRDYLAWAEITNQIETYRKLSETERRHMLQAEQILTVQDAMLMIGAIMAGVKEHVTDRNAYAAISANVTKVIGQEVG